MKRDDINKKLFKVIIPKICTYSEEEIETFGMRIDGKFDKDGFVESDKDKLKLNLDTRVMIPVSKMIDIYANGYPIKVPNRDDIIKIGDMLDDYLHNNFTDNSIHLRNVVDDRKETIQAFMDEILNRHIKKFEIRENEKLKAFDLGNVTLMNTMTGEFGNHRPNISLSVNNQNSTGYRQSYTVNEGDNNVSPQY